MPALPALLLVVLGLHLGAVGEGAAAVPVADGGTTSSGEVEGPRTSIGDGSHGGSVGVHEGSDAEAGTHTETHAGAGGGVAGAEGWQGGGLPVRVNVRLAHPVMAGESVQESFVWVGVMGEAPSGPWSGEVTAGERAQRLPVNLALVMDRSATMQGDRLRLACQAVVGLLDWLQPDDVLAIVVYDSNVQVLQPASRQPDRGRLTQLLEQLEAQGHSNLFGGITRGAAELRKFTSSDRLSRVILLSDGKATIGPGTPKALGELGASLQKEGISVTTIGLGLDYNEDLMVELAARSHGNHHFVEHPDQLAAAFEAELQQLNTVAATDLVLMLEFAPGVTPVRSLGRPAEIADNQVTARFGQVSWQRESALLLEVNIDPAQVDEAVPVVRTELAPVELAWGVPTRSQVAGYQSLAPSRAPAQSGAAAADRRAQQSVGRPLAQPRPQAAVAGAIEPESESESESDALPAAPAAEPMAEPGAAAAMGLELQEDVQVALGGAVQLPARELRRTETEIGDSETPPVAGQALAMDVAPARQEPAVDADHAELSELGDAPFGRVPMEQAGESIQLGEADEVIMAEAPAPALAFEAAQFGLGSDEAEAFDSTYRTAPYSGVAEGEMHAREEQAGRGPAEDERPADMAAAMDGADGEVADAPRRQAAEAAEAVGRVQADVAAPAALSGAEVQRADSRPAPPAPAAPATVAEPEAAQASQTAEPEEADGMMALRARVGALRAGDPELGVTAVQGDDAGGGGMPDAARGLMPAAAPVPQLSGHAEVAQDSLLEVPTAGLGWRGRSEPATDAPRLRFSADPGEVDRNADTAVLAAAKEQQARQRSERAIELRDAGDIEQAEAILLQNTMELEELSQRYADPGLQQQAVFNRRDADNVGRTDGEWERQRKVMRARNLLVEQYGIQPLIEASPGDAPATEATEARSPGEADDGAGETDGSDAAPDS